MSNVCLLTTSATTSKWSILAARSITARVLTLPAFLQCKTISCYLSMPAGEVTTSHLVSEIISQDSNVASFHSQEVPTPILLIRNVFCSKNPFKRWIYGFLWDIWRGRSCIFTQWDLGDQRARFTVGREAQDKRLVYSKDVDVRLTSISLSD